ncbi:MAG TPA: lysophospholipid acyltransferase family protein [Mycobacterium sp.]|nr:lysophospholipid acyltransferase family protein [Mycobacterium sp.]
MQPVYRTLEILAKTLVKITDTQITYTGLEHIPRSGGAVVTINHTSYVDFLPAGLAVVRSGRRMRYMAKIEMQDVGILRFLMKHTGTIPVDRTAGADAYQHAVAALRAGEVVGVYPESTISRTFELRALKTGAARMARDAQVPIVPLIVWGAHRIWTKDHPKSLGRNHIPVTVAVGAPLAPDDDLEKLEAALQTRMTELLHRVQEEYPHPPGAYWVPRRLGGGAPTAEEALARREAELAERARQRAGRAAAPEKRPGWRRALARLRRRR